MPPPSHSGPQNKSTSMFLADLWESTKNLPVMSSHAWWRDSLTRQLGSPLSVDIGGVFFCVGRPWQDDVRHLYPMVSMVTWRETSLLVFTACIFSSYWATTVGTHYKVRQSYYWGSIKQTPVYVLNTQTVFLSRTMIQLINCQFPPTKIQYLW